MRFRTSRETLDALGVKSDARTREYCQICTEEVNRGVDVFIALEIVGDGIYG